MNARGFPKYAQIFTFESGVMFPGRNYSIAAQLHDEDKEFLQKYFKKDAFVIVGNAFTDIGVMAVVNEFRVDDVGSASIDVKTFFRVRTLEVSSENQHARNGNWEILEEDLTEEEFLAERFKGQLKVLASWSWGITGTIRRIDLPDLQSLATVSGYIDRLSNMLNEYIDDYQFVKEGLIAILSENNIGKRLSAAVHLHKRLYVALMNTRGGDTKKNGVLLSNPALRGNNGKPERPQDAQEDSLPDFLKNIDLNKYPEEVQKVIKEQLKQLKNAGSSETGVIERYLDWLVKLEWTRSSPDIFDLAQIENSLDEDHYGLGDEKEVILEHFAVQRLKPDAKGRIICFVGPPGVGKTALAKSIAKATGRKLIRMSLGGVRDEADIRGHRRTYVGAMPGRIMHAMKDAGVVNPIIVLDEIDKLTANSNQGNPAAALLEVLDPEQNFSFVDHYIGIPYNLSRVTFIATANDVYALPPALRDRMKVMFFAGYSEEEKLEIAKRHLIAKQITEHGLEADYLKAQGKPEVDVRFFDAAIRKIINEYTREAGVRNLERAVETVMDKIVKSLYKMPLETDKIVREITPENVKDYLGQSPVYETFGDLGHLPPGVGTVLMVGGDGEGMIEMLEISLGKKDKLDVKNTGCLKQVLDESIDVTISRLLHPGGLLSEKVSTKKVIHSHLDAAGVPKDGPSAGVMHFVTLYSAMIGVPVKPYFSVTGEITLRRNMIYPVGGIKDKVLAGKREGLREICVPKINLRDVEAMLKKNKLDVDLLISGKSWTNLDQLKEISRVEKDRLTIYALESPEEALAIAFPDHYPELPPDFKLPEELMAEKKAEVEK